MRPRSALYVSMCVCACPCARVCVCVLVDAYCRLQARVQTYDSGHSWKRQTKGPLASWLKEAYQGKHTKPSAAVVQRAASRRGIDLQDALAADSAGAPGLGGGRGGKLKVKVSAGVDDAGVVNGFGNMGLEGAGTPDSNVGGKASAIAMVSAGWGQGNGGDGGIMSRMGRSAEGNERGVGRGAGRTAEDALDAAETAPLLAGDSTRGGTMGVGEVGGVGGTRGRDGKSSLASSASDRMRSMRSVEPQREGHSTGVQRGVAASRQSDVLLRHDQAQVSACVSVCLRVTRVRVMPACRQAGRQAGRYKRPKDAQADAAQTLPSHRVA